MLILLVRVGFVILSTLVGWRSGEYFYKILSGGALEAWTGAALGFGIAVTLIAAEQAWRKRFSRSLVAFLIGTAGGLLLASLANYVMRVSIQSEDLRNNLDMPMSLIIVYLVLVTTLHNIDRFRLVLPFVEFRGERLEIEPLFIDIAALGDSRTPTLCSQVFPGARVLIHRRLLRQAELMAASAVIAEQIRGHRLMEGLAELRQIAEIKVSIDETELPLANPNDLEGSLHETLIGLCRLQGARLLAGDHDLAIRGRAEGLHVIDLPILAGALHPAIRPGEMIRVRIDKVGDGKDQGVGSLDDGSLCIVTGASGMVGRRVEVSIVRLHQSGNGRMVFADLVSTSKSAAYLVAQKNPAKA